MILALAAELSVFAAAAYFVSRQRRTPFLRSFIALVCISVLIGAALVCSTIVQGIFGVQKFITGYNPITRIVEGWSAMEFQFSLFNALLAVDIWSRALRYCFFVLGPLTALSVPWCSQKRTRIFVCSAVFFVTLYAIFFYDFLDLTGGVAQYLTENRRVVNDVLGRTFHFYFIPIDVFWAYVVGSLSQSFFEHVSHAATLQTVGRNAMLWTRRLVIAALAAFFLWLLFAMRLPVQGRLVIQVFKSLSIGKLSYLSGSNDKMRRDLGVASNAILFGGSDILASLGAKVSLSVKSGNAAAEVKADVSRVTIPSDLTNSDWRTSLLGFRGGKATDEWTLGPGPLEVISGEYQKLACLVGPECTIAVEAEGPLELISAERDAKDDALGEKQDGLTLSVSTKKSLTITVGNMQDGEIVWHPETQLIEQDQRRSILYSDQRHVEGAEGIVVNQVAGGVVTRLNRNTKFRSDQTLPYPALLSLHDLQGGSYTIKARSGEIVFRNAERQFGDLFPLKDAQEIGWLSSTVTKGFLRLGFNEPLNLQPDDTIRLQSAHGVRIFRDSDRNMVIEGTFDSLDINNEPVGKTVWGQLSDAVRFWTISSIIGFILVSLRIDRTLANWIRKTFENMRKLFGRYAAKLTARR